MARSTCYLLRRYGGRNVPSRLAGYNAGEGNVNKWSPRRRGARQALDVGAIPFGEPANVRRCSTRGASYARPTVELDCNQSPPRTSRPLRGTAARPVR